MTVLFLCSLSLLPQKWNLTSPGPYFCPRLATCTRNPGLYLSRIAEKAMAPHSSTLAWKIPWTEEPGGLQSMGSRLSNFTFTFDFHALEKEMATKMKTAEIVTVICTFSQHKMCIVKESNPYRILNLEWTIPTIN